MLGTTLARIGHLSRVSKLVDQECVAGRWLIKCKDCGTVEYEQVFDVQEQRLHLAVMRPDATTHTSTFVPALGYSRFTRNVISRTNMRMN